MGTAWRCGLGRLDAKRGGLWGHAAAGSSGVGGSKHSFGSGGLSSGGEVIDYAFPIYNGVTNEYWERDVSDEFILQLLYGGSSGDGRLTARSVNSGAELVGWNVRDVAGIALDGDTAYYFDLATQDLMEWPLSGAQSPSALASARDLALNLNDLVIATAFDHNLCVAKSRYLSHVDIANASSTPIADLSSDLVEGRSVSSMSGNIKASARGLFFVSYPDHAEHYVAFAGVQPDPSDTPVLDLGSALWARGYWVATSGNVTDEVWKKYIEAQKPEPPDDNFQVV